MALDAERDSPPRHQELSFLLGGGEMGARMREVDWAKTPLGDACDWPESLKTCVRIILTSRQPMFVWWGDLLINLYNDAYKSIVGGKHPHALGQPASVVWREIWDQVGPRAATTMGGNEGTYDEALLLIMERNGYPEETYYTFSYSPVPNERGGTGGIICANTDDTQRIVGQRQLALLRDLAARTVNSKTVVEACSVGAGALTVENRDLPFALIYLLSSDHGSAELVAQAGIEAAHPLAPRNVPLMPGQLWPLAELVESKAGMQVVALEPAQHAPQGFWPRSPESAAVLPIVASGRPGAVGFLVTGLNPFRLLDDGYRGFLELVVAQLAASIANAQTYEDEKRRAEALAELDRAKTAFFSNVSHEFRTPLTLMLGPLEEALHAPARALTGENLETTYRNSVRLLKLVNTLLDFSRIEAGRAQASYVPTGLASLTRDLASAFRSAITRAGLTFEVECEDLEPVHVDHDMWEKIVLNLLSNALKFTFQGKIAVKLAGRGGDVVLSVSDTGTGIPEHELPHVFERFRRVEGMQARTHEGSGIGLALVAELVKLHGGQIHAESKVGAGTTFTVSIPCETAHLPSERIGKARTLASAATGAAPFVQEALRWLPGTDDPLPSSLGNLPLGREDQVAGSEILLADDNADMRDYLVRLLRERYTVRPCADGAQALALARERPPDLVLTDVMMPHLDGFGLLRALRADLRTNGVSVIMLSARAGEESRVEGLEAGADDYLPKPFSARELFARVTTHLQIARLRRQAESERGKLLELFRQSPLPITVFEGSELRYALANPPYCQIVGRQELVGLRLSEAFPELSGHAFIANVAAVFESGSCRP